MMTRYLLVMLLLILAGVAGAQTKDFKPTTPDTGIIWMTTSVDTTGGIKWKWSCNYIFCGKATSKIYLSDDTWIDSAYVVTGKDTVGLLDWVKNKYKEER